MLTRIVKLTFKTEKIADFEQLFEKTRQNIQGFEGCISLTLLQDIKNPNIFFTYSQWKSEANLNSYRNSVFFEKVWGRTKVMFAARPEAWSVHKKYASNQEAF